MINIGKDNTDKSYRYKMPPLQTKIEGRGNGIKTVIVNIVEIAKALHIDPSYPTKFFGYELGAQSKFSPRTDRAVVNGAFTAQDLSKTLERFIDAFILCPKCRLPEIKMEVRKEKIRVDCAACGHNTLLETSHRLKQYILKNPPSAKAAKGTVGGEAAKTKKKETPGKGKKKEKERIVRMKRKKKGEKRQRRLAKRMTQKQVRRRQKRSG